MYDTRELEKERVTTQGTDKSEYFKFRLIFLAINRNNSKLIRFIHMPQSFMCS